MNCQKLKSKLADMLLNPQSVPVELWQHVESCASCGGELGELRATIGLLDEWPAQAPSPFFDAKLLARLKTEKLRKNVGFLEKWKSRFVYGSSLRMQPLMAGALCLVALVGGGTYADLSWQSYHQDNESAAVRDLKSLDGNAQVFQQLDSIDQSVAQDDQNPGTVGPSSD